MFSFSSTAPKHALEAVESELFTEPLTLCFRKAFHSWPTLVGLWYLDTSFTSFKRPSQCVLSDQNKTFLVSFNVFNIIKSSPRTFSRSKCSSTLSRHFGHSSGRKMGVDCRPTEFLWAQMPDAA